MKHILFTTKRLVIRKLLPDDLPSFHRLESDERVTRFTGSDPVLTLVENQKRLEDVIYKYNDEEVNLWVFAVCLIATNEMIGTCAYFKSEEGKYEIGYRIIPEYWGQGFASELVPEILTYGLKNIKLPYLGAYIFTDNIASVRIVEKAGMILVNEFFNEKYQLMDRYYEFR
jgi:[ribosomal protein S5]-alanine N-acetyltransferase